MCRLMLANRDAVKYLGEDLVEEMFQFLEDMQGGDGMGVAAMWKDGHTVVHKSATMIAPEAAHWIYRAYEQGAVYFAFHTRMATHGSVCTKNCHPFKHGSLVMAHNGVVSEFGNVLGDRTDSQALAMTLARTGMSTDFLSYQSGVFVGFRDGKPFVVKGQSTTSLFYVSSGKAWLFASSLPKSFEDYFDIRTDLGTYEWYGALDAKGFPKRWASPSAATTGTLASGYAYSYYDTDEWDDSWEQRSKVKEKKAAKLEKRLRRKLGKWAGSTTAYQSEEENYTGTVSYTSQGGSVWTRGDNGIWYVSTPSAAVSALTSQTRPRPEIRTDLGAWPRDNRPTRPLHTPTSAVAPYGLYPTSDQIGLSSHVQGNRVRSSWTGDYWFTHLNVLIVGDFIAANATANTTGEELEFRGGLYFIGTSTRLGYFWYKGSFQSVPASDEDDYAAAIDAEIKKELANERS